MQKWSRFWHLGRNSNAGSEKPKHSIQPASDRWLHLWPVPCLTKGSGRMRNEYLNLVPAGGRPGPSTNVIYNLSINAREAEVKWWRFSFYDFSTTPHMHASWQTKAKHTHTHTCKGRENWNFRQKKASHIKHTKPDGISQQCGSISFRHFTTGGMSFGTAEWRCLSITIFFQLGG